MDMLTYLLFLTILLSPVIAQNVENNPNTNSTAIMFYPTWLNSSQTQYNQFLADNYNYFMTPKGNRMWGCAMNLAWNQLKKGLLYNQNPDFMNMTELQHKMVQNFNADIFTKSELSQDSYYVSSGFGQEAVDRINFEVRQKFPNRTFMPLNYNLQKKDFISFAYLFKNFKFQSPFTDTPIFMFNGKQVRGFEVKRPKQRKQLFYKYYNNRNDFMLGINTLSPNDEILLWRTNQTGLNDLKFQKILKMIEFYNSMPSLPLARIDKFMMPVVNIEYDRTYKELIKMRFANKGYQDYVIAQMSEKIKLMVTKSGVVLQNQGSVVAMFTSSFMAKYFYLNSDFWLIMKEKNKRPYLVMLVREVNQTWAL